MTPLNLHLVLKHRYYYATEYGYKKIEYRDNTPYWRKRIVEKWDSNGGNKVTFHKGYTNTTITLGIKHLILSDKGIELHLGPVIEKKGEKQK